MLCPSGTRSVSAPTSATDGCSDGSHDTPDGYCRYVDINTDYLYLVGMGKGPGSFPYHTYPSWGNQGWDYYYQYMKWNDSAPDAAPVRLQSDPAKTVCADVNAYYTQSFWGDQYAKANHGRYSGTNEGWTPFVAGFEGGNRVRGDGAVRWVGRQEMAADGGSVSGSTFTPGRYSALVVGTRDYSYYW
jgi:hypothetical protein